MFVNLRAAFDTVDRSVLGNEGKRNKEKANSKGGRGIKKNKKLDKNRRENRREFLDSKRSKTRLFAKSNPLQFIDSRFGSGNRGNKLGGVGG